MLKENVILMEAKSSLRVCEYDDVTGGGKGFKKDRWEIPVMVDDGAELRRDSQAQARTQETPAACDGRRRCE
jgi:hypothetical protein